MVRERRSQLTRSGKTEKIEPTAVMSLSENGTVLVIDSTMKRAGHDGAERSRLVFHKK